MFSKFKAVLAGLALAAVSFSASAAPWSQTLSPNKYIGEGATYDWTHNLTGAGFQPGTDLITDFTLTLKIEDDKCTGIGNCIAELFDVELAFVNLPGVLSDTFIQAIGTSTIGGSILGVLQLNLFGELSVSLSSVVGDFVLKSAKLVANGVDGGNQVPEPGALALLGLGLAGLAVARRRQQKQA